ncbi:hypothetical protein COHA_009341 [Chlorella ohadii]|uniref:Uncharacterized protein n=1 Tax=Chlorella ohadii TaxID=2649997 RepID=A0AAD5GXY0_9CHLO|nr:hypothetical protein COHA_009341 [Chlorella ohadii]
MGAAGAIAHRGLALACLGLLFVGWAIFLGGVASLQQACPNALGTGTVAALPGATAPGATAPAGGAGLPASLVGLLSPGQLQQLAAQGGQGIQQEIARLSGRRLTQDTSLGGLLASVAGQPGYLAPVACNKLFSYPWWIWAFLTFMFVLLAVGATTFNGRLRGMLVALSAALLVLLMNTANTFLYVNYIDGLPGTIAARGRVLAAGAIMSSIALFLLIMVRSFPGVSQLSRINVGGRSPVISSITLFLLIMVLGWHNEDAPVEVEYDTEATGKKKGRKAAGGGGVLGKLGLKKGREEGAEEEPPGAGTAGSPRYIQVCIMVVIVLDFQTFDNLVNRKLIATVLVRQQQRRSRQGHGTAGSPRYIQVPHPTPRPAPTGVPATGGAGLAPGTIIPGPISSHGPGIVCGGSATTVTTTTVAPAVPVSTQAVYVS